MLLGKYGVTMGQYSNYYPQGNGFGESINKNIIQFIKKIVSNIKRDWNKFFINVLWESRITPKGSTGQYPYLLAYGKESLLFVILQINALTTIC